jgi:hypothetical protein
MRKSLGLAVLYVIGGRVRVKKVSLVNEERGVACVSAGSNHDRYQSCAYRSAAQRHARKCVWVTDIEVAYRLLV